MVDDAEFERIMSGYCSSTSMFEYQVASLTSTPTTQSPRTTLLLAVKTVCVSVLASGATNV